MLGFGHRVMSERDFWELVAVMGGELGDDAVERLRRALVAHGRKDVVAFHHRLVERLHELDREIICDQPARLVDDLSADDPPLPNSDDSFLYLRAGIVVLGRETYESVLADPTVLTRGRWEWCEELLYLAEEVIGDDIETDLSYETGSNTRFWSPRVEPEREPWDQGTRLVVVDVRSMENPIHGSTVDSQGNEIPIVMYTTPRWLDTALVYDMTMTFARSVTLNGGLPPELACQRVQLQLDLGTSWQLRPTVSAPARHPEGFDDALVVTVGVGVPAEAVRAWSGPVRAEALQAAAALALLAVLPADHAAHDEIQTLYERGAHHMPG